MFLISFSAGKIYNSFRVFCPSFLLCLEKNSDLSSDFGPEKAEAEGVDRPL